MKEYLHVTSAEEGMSVRVIVHVSLGECSVFN